MSVWYQFDSVHKDVLIRCLGKEYAPEILHKGDKEWGMLAPRPNDEDELYTRAVWLGEGCWEWLDTITEEEAIQILHAWGYKVIPPGDPKADMSS